MAGRPGFHAAPAARLVNDSGDVPHDHATASHRRLARALILPAAGCDAEPQGQGPGHRKQKLALSPEQELELGRKAYREILGESKVLPQDSPQVRRVTKVGERIAGTVKIEPLMREINLDVKDYRFEWEFNVLEDRHVNAFCLPGGKVAVFTRFAEGGRERRPAGRGPRPRGGPRAGTPRQRAAGRGAARGASGMLAALREKAFDRGQESEADHIGLFLMTFAGYDPSQAVVFWKRMKQISDEQGRVPEILSDHPSDEKRIKQLRGVGAAGAGGEEGLRRGAGRAAERTLTDVPVNTHHQGEFTMSIGGGGPLLGSGGFFGNAGPSGPYGPYAGCGCSTLFIILAGILLVCAGGMRMFNF